MEKAIKRAIEGGYEDKNLIDWCKEAQNDAPLLLDPLFWQALGKAEGWGSFYDVKGMPRNYDTRGWYPDTGDTAGSGYDNKMWQAHWHRFIDALASGNRPTVSLRPYSLTLQ